MQKCRLSILSLTIFIASLLVPTTIFAAPVTSTPATETLNTSTSTSSGSLSSLEGDFFNKTFAITLNNGTDIFYGSNGFISKRENYNKKIHSNTQEKRISLYDRFGGNISFVPYFGEKKFDISLVDKFYTSLKNNEDFSLNKTLFDTLWNKEDAQSNNVVYDGRYDIISELHYKTGYIDSRRQIFAPVSISGGDAAVGNMYLSASKTITAFVGFFAGNGLYNQINNIWSKIITSGFWKTLTTIVKRFLPFAVMLFVVCLVFVAFKIVKGDLSVGKGLLMGVNFIVAFGIIYSFLLAPNMLKTFTGNLVGGVDKLFATTLNFKADAVSKSDDLTYVTEASLWRKTVLDPWCKGMFDGLTYNKLYTQYASVSGSNKKLAQSNQNIRNVWAGKKLRYNSAMSTGDISVPLYKGKNVKNWAALAWSCQSIYHIDAVKPGTLPPVTNGLKGELSWPNASRTPLNASIYADNFRWLDAKLNISPGYTSPTENDGNYKNSNSYTHNFTLAGLDSLFMSLLLLPLLYPIFRRIIFSIKIVSIALRWIGRSVMTLIHPGENKYGLGENFKIIFKPIYYYGWWTLVLFLMISIYLTITGGFLGNVIWLILALVICRVKPIETPQQLRSIYNKAKKDVSANIKKFKEKVTK